MGLFSGLSRGKYDDAEIVGLATRAIEQDPVIENPGGVIVTSQDGIVTLSGSVSSEMQMRHAEEAVNSALRTSSLKYAEIVNSLVVGD